MNIRHKVLDLRPERTEQIEIKVYLDVSAAEKYKAQLDVLKLAGLVIPTDLKKDDLLKVTYSLKANYFGDTASCLSAVADILSDKSLVRYGNLSELEHGRSLIVEVANKLQEVMKQL